MDVITCHLNADFDALASMMAAKKLYPEAHLVFPGAQERSMREFFMKSTLYALTFDRIKNINLDDVTRLILVDTKTRDRIGRFAEIVDRPGLSVHVYDHHPFGEEDIRGEFERVEQLGACTTIFAEILKEKGVKITPVEATIMALGIYEETGSLVFTSTTPRDVMAAAWLLSKGANLNIVADFITRELEADQVGLLNDLLKNMTAHHFDGIKVVIASASSPTYVQDLAIIAHKLRDMENLDVLFVVVAMEERVHIVARSRIDDVDVGAVAHEFGGGGHPSAASASIRDMNLNQVVERLVTRLRQTVHPAMLARDIMTRPVVTIQDTANIRETGLAMTRYNVNVLPVLQGEKLVGLVTRDIVQRSLHHGLGDQPMTELMTTDYHTAGPDTPFKKVEEIMIKHIQRFLPVTEEGRVIGAITRTDLLRALHDVAMSRPWKEPEDDSATDDAFTRNLRPLMEARLPGEVLELLREVGSTADELGQSAYVVGGFVRDLLLGVENLDLDIVVEGDGIAFAHSFAKKNNARVRSHQKFGTAVVIPPTGMKFDIATARTEYYEFPAALPTVELGSIKKDLHRRDFTINALAIKINKEGFGGLIDFFGGQRDLKEGTIRVLHNLSLIEDPTRAYRAIRFEARMGFTISRHTQNLIKNAVNMDLFNRLAGRRVYAELALIFREASPLHAINRMDQFGLLRFIHPKLSFTQEMKDLFSHIAETLAWYRLLFLDVEADTWLVYFMGLLDRFTSEETKALGRKLAIPERHMKKLCIAKAEGASVLNEFHRSHRLKPHEVYRMLRPLPLEVLLYMMARTKKAHSKKYVSLYLTQYRDVETILSGEDLMGLGLPPGPSYKKVFKMLLEARLNGEVETREDEEARVIEYVKKHPDALKVPAHADPSESGKEGAGAGGAR